MQDSQDIIRVKEGRDTSLAYLEDKKTIIHISKAVSDAKGYFCPGCGYELMAVHNLFCL